VLDEQGYQFLLSEDQVDKAVGPVEIGRKKKGVKLGVDVAQGGNNTVYVLRDDKQAMIDKAVKTGGPDWIEKVCGLTIEYMRSGISAENVSVDGTGIGSGVSSKLIGDKYAINNVVWGSAASPESKKEADNKKLPHFMNMRAECYWLLREWIISGGKIDNNDNLISQLKGIKYRINSSGKIQVQPKEDMILSTDSPDEADALAETFVTTGMFKVDSEYVETNSAFEDMGISASDMEEFSMSKFDRGR